jgi:hypothetical protein
MIQLPGRLWHKDATNNLHGDQHNCKTSSVIGWRILPAVLLIQVSPGIVLLDFDLCDGVHFP